MKEPIKLKVPAKPKSEFVSQGNFGAELKPNGTVETESREFADFLINQYGLTETSAGDSSENDAPPPSGLEAEYPADFPYRNVFISQKIPIETVRGLDREQLISVKGLGAKSADEVLAYAPAPIVPLVPATGDGTLQNSDNGGQE